MLAVIEKIRWIFEFMKNGDQQVAILHFGLNEKIFMYICVCVCVCVRVYIYITCNIGNIHSCITNFVSFFEYSALRFFHICTK